MGILGSSRSVPLDRTHHISPQPVHRAITLITLTLVAQAGKGSRTRLSRSYSCDSNKGMSLPRILEVWVMQLYLNVS